MKKFIVTTLLFTSQTGLYADQNPTIPNTNMPAECAVKVGEQMSSQERKRIAQEALWKYIEDGRLDEQSLKQCLENGADLNDSKVFEFDRGFSTSKGPWGRGDKMTYQTSQQKLSPRDYAIIRDYSDVDALLARHQASTSIGGLKLLWDDVSIGRVVISPQGEIELGQQTIDEKFLGKIRSISQALKGPLTLEERLKLKKPVQEKYFDCTQKCARWLEYKESCRFDDSSGEYSNKRECLNEQKYAAYLAALDPQIESLQQHNSSILDKIPLQY